MRAKMADSTSEDLTLKRQCSLLSICRTSIYYTPQTSPMNKLLMDRIDELFTDDPTRGTRRLRAAMRRQFGLEVGAQQDSQADGPYGPPRDLPGPEHLEAQ